MSKHGAVARYWVLAFLAQACAATGERIDSSPSTSGATRCSCCDERYEPDDDLAEVRAKFLRSERRRIAAHNDRTRELYEHVRANGGYEGSLAHELSAYETYVRELGSEQRENDDRAPQGLAKEHAAMAKCDRLTLSWVSSSPVIEPEMEVVLLGCQFGVRRGQVFLTLVNSRFRSVELEVQPSDWNDGDILAKVPMIVDEVDQPARIYLIRTDGTRSDDYPIEFRARREIKRVGGDYFTVRTWSTSTEDAFRIGGGINSLGDCKPTDLLPGYDPSVTFTYASTSARADHWQSCCWPPTQSFDTWHVALKNGWMPHHLTHAFAGRKSSWALVPQPGRVDSVTGFAPNSADVEFSFHWWTDQYESGVKYAFQLYVVGPAGSKYADAIEPAYQIDTSDPCWSSVIPPL